jgi:PAS domain S-box-containing protein
MTLTRRLLLLALIAVLPAIVIWTYTEVSLRRAREAEVHELAKRQAELAASELERIFDGVHTLLMAVAEVPAVRNLDTPACVPYLEGLQARLPHLLSISALDPDGRVRCRQVPPPADLRFDDRPYFKQAFAGEDFVIGEYTEGRVARKPVLPLAIPLRDERSRVIGVVAAALDLAWLGQQLSERSLPIDGSITVADRNGTIIAREPFPDRFVGTKIPAAFTHLVTAPASGAVEVMSQDGTRRVLGYAPIGVAPKGIYVSIGLSTKAAYSAINAAARRGFMLIAAAFVLALSLAWLSGRVFVSRPVSVMTRAVQSWREGNYDARIALPKGSGEFGVLGDAFNDLMDDIARRQRALQESEERARLALDAGHMGTWWLDPVRQTGSWSSQAATILGLPPERTEVSYAEWAALLNPDDRREIERRLDRALAGEGDFEAEYRIDSFRGERWIHTRGRVFFDEDRNPVRIVGILNDITARKHAEEQQRLLLDELNHRVKNTLATVQSIASQTLRATSEPERFRTSFESRLLALSKTHDLLTRNAWRDADLHAILEQETAPYRRDGEQRISVSGPTIRLPARVAINLGLVVHELVTNAAKYGALSSPAGRVDIEWILERRDGSLHLRLTWREAHGPRVAAPTHHGFGSRLIRRSIEGELAGQVDLAFLPGGLAAELSFPLPAPFALDTRAGENLAVAV